VAVEVVLSQVVVVVAAVTVTVQRQLKNLSPSIVALVVLEAEAVKVAWVEKAETQRRWKCMCWAAADWVASTVGTESLVVAWVVLEKAKGEVPVGLADWVVWEVDLAAQEVAD
jgi:hypothetical protein